MNTFYLYNKVINPTNQNVDWDAFMTFCYINDYDVDTEESLIMHIRHEYTRVHSDDYKKKISQKIDADSAMIIAKLQKKFKKYNEDEEDDE